MVLQVNYREIESGIIVIELIGRAVLGAESQPMEVLVPQLIQLGHRNFIIDLAGVTHIDSTGIGRCIFSFNKVKQAKGQLLLSGATGHVRDAFRVTRLDTVMQFYLTVEAAREVFRPAAQRDAQN